MVKAKKLYRKEDIIAMDQKIVNAGWGPSGTDTYSIWQFKGGGSCRHFWTRIVFFRKRNADGTFMKNAGLKNDERVSVNKARKEGFKPNPMKEEGEESAAKLPRDMENRGFIDPRKFKTPQNLPIK